MRKNMTRMMLVMVLLVTGSALQAHAANVPAPTPQLATGKLQLDLPC